MQISSLSSIRPVTAPLGSQAVDAEFQPINDPLALTLEMAEEIGFIRAERKRSAGVSSEEEAPAFKDALASAMAKALAEQQKRVNPTELQAQVDDLLAHLPSAQDQKALNDLLTRYSKGSSTYALLLLTQIVDSQRAVHKGYTPALLRAYAHQHEAEITAFLNIQPVISHLNLNDGNEMMATYEETVIRSHSVLETFSTLNQRYGLDKVDQWRPFLMNAIVADLTSVPHSAEPAQLQLLLQEMQHFYIYNSLMYDAKHVNRHTEDKPIALQEFLNYLQYPSKHYASIAERVQEAQVQKKIIFHQDFREMTKNVTSRAFANAQQKTSALLLLQNKIDDLVWSEENL